MIISRPALILIHLICWLIFLSLPVIFIAGHGGKSFTAIADPVQWLPFIIYVIIFYLHTYFLLPELYFKRKYLLYVLSVLLMAASVFFLRPFDRLMANHEKGGKVVKSTRNEVSTLQADTCKPGSGNHMKKGASLLPVSLGKQWRPKFDIVSFVLFMVVIAISTTIMVSKRWRVAVEEASRAIADKANTELSLLKAQINPHFLFNTLNNIYSLAVTKDENTAESILKLSNIMRYVTDDAKEGFVSLQSETDFISDYIELQRLRLGASVKLDFKVSGDLNNKVIAPMILITFVENVFKYGTSNSAPSEILIELKSVSNEVHFFCRNRILPFKQSLEGTEIGIINTKKRLEHLYSGMHELDIKNEGGFYTVNLVLFV